MKSIIQVVVALSFILPGIGMGGELMPWETEEHQANGSSPCDRYGEDPRLQRPRVLESCMQDQKGIFSALNAPDCSILGDRSKPLSEGQVRACMGQYSPLISDFFWKWQKSNRNTYGSSVFLIKASADGSVLEVKVLTSSTMNAEFNSSLAELVKGKVKLPSSSSGWNEEYTFNFLPP